MLRVATAFILALSVVTVAAAQTRTVPARDGKLVAKLGTIGGFTSAAQLASLITGNGVVVSNARFTGNPNAAGTFAGSQADLGIDGGVLLSTGRVGDAQGPNEAPDWTTDFELPGDPDLDNVVAPYATQDAAILEFDIVPADSTIGIRFVFASEEYKEFVNSPFNDVLAIFVNGVNCANFNGRPVSVNTINHEINSGFFIDNEAGGKNTELDGLTVPLECVAAVTPGAVNRVKIAIADTSDGLYDAAVFLAAAGVRSPGSGAITGSTLAKSIEYYHAGFDHYFVTAIPNEITLLDNGTLAGWSRTGQAFNVFVTGTPGTVEVCRFFSTAFGLRSSHFYTPDANECAIVTASATWQFEGRVFNVVPPNGDGSCPTATQPLYRLYNNGQGGSPNHRYTTDLGLFDAMVLLGWIPEGSGIGVIACVPT
jgi:hypothetical protein